MDESDDHLVRAILALDGIVTPESTCVFILFDCSLHFGRGPDATCSCIDAKTCQHMSKPQHDTQRQVALLYHDLSKMGIPPIIHIDT